MRPDPRYAPVGAAAQLRQLPPACFEHDAVASPGGGYTTLTYFTYDWNLNQAPPPIPWWGYTNGTTRRGF
jgi:hypothetical protein